MPLDNLSADDYGGNKYTRFLRKCNEFRSKPAAVLIVSTMAVFTDTVVYGLIVPFLPDILQEKLGMSSSSNGLLFGCFGIGVLIGAPVSAYISDRWKIRKWPMILGLLGLGATSVLFALSNAYWELIVARLAQGISSGITWAIGLGMIADVYPGESMGQAMGIAFSGFTLGYLGGPVLGGAIYSGGGVHAIAIFVGAIAVLDLVFRLLLVEPKTILSAQFSPDSSFARLEQNEKLLHSSGGEFISGSRRQIASQALRSSPALISSTGGVGKTSSIMEIQEPLEIRPSTADSRMSAPVLLNSSKHTASANSSARNSIDVQGQQAKRRTTMLDLLKEWPILACCLATITITGAAGSFEPTLPIYMKEKYNSSTIVISVVFIAIVIPNVVIAPLAGKYTSDKRVLNKVAPFGRFGFMIGGSVLQAIVIACLGATSSIAGLVVTLVFVGLVGGIAAVPILSTMGEHVERMGGDAYAKVYALFNIAYSVGVIIVPTVLPPIMNAVGFAATMGVVSAVLVFGALILAIQPTIMLIKYGRSAFIGDNARPFL
ncbi:hypothetical protein IWW36_004779 [Coemansia brasiliensis]|uniref:Major facilitator superfamily (MFS) profile domain-containing protein n=1 Tax=Coemansia brasiliensis TaxID=2650707 RepID=A0A9W8I482_9FUNG|nr:hypothetical protein IWW36_004779 [Coemansia brasiliensis]